MAFGQIRRTDFSGAEFQNSILIFMISAGGRFPVGTSFPNHVFMGVNGEFQSEGKVMGYRVKEIIPSGAAETAGLQISDFIIRIAGDQAKNQDELLNAAAKAAKKPTYKVEVIRAGKPMSFELARMFRPTVTEQIVPVQATPQPERNDAITSSTSIADELIKLAKLRDDKILTEEEFQAQKAKLLAQ